MNKYAPLPEETKEAILTMYKTCPHINAKRIAERFGISPMTLSRLVAERGLTRKRGECRKTAGDAYAYPDHPNRRAGGILANDEQWAARHHRIGGCE